MASYSQTLTDSLGVADRHTWSEMIYSWDNYTGTWDSYGDIELTFFQVSIRTFTEAITNTEAFSRIATAHRTLADSISHTESFLKKQIKTLTEAITHTETFRRIATTIRTLAETMTLTESISKISKKILAEAVTLTATLIKSPIKRISNTLGMTEHFTKIQLFIRTLTETLNVNETDWTWDMMTATWDDYTENWDYYSKAFQVRKILVRAISDGMTFTDSILARAMAMIKGFAMKIVGAVPFGIIKTEKMSGRISGENGFGKISSQDLGGSVEKENLFGKISNS